MTDWARVRRLRAKGWDWPTIAGDPRVEFTPAEGVGEPGRALKALYLARQSRARRAGKAEVDTDSTSPTETRTRRGRVVAVLGVALLLGGILWMLFAFAYPPVAVLIAIFPPTIPDITLVALLGAVLLAVAFVFELGPVSETWKRGVGAGVVVGIILVGSSAFAVYQAGIPNLSSVITPEPGQGWEKAANPVWSSGGQPIVFFYGSQACPYCSASSWAIYAALQPFGAWSGTGFATSDPNDVFPNTPEVALSGSSLQSSYLSWDPKEDANTQQIQFPGVSPVEKAYIQAYDKGGIPFFVIGGIYVHTGTIVSPQPLQGLTPQQVSQSMSNANSNDPVYNAIHAQVLYLEAYLVKICQTAGTTPPSQVTSDPGVQSILTQIV